MVYIVNKNGEPLMPSIRYRHIKELIKNGLAKKISSKPFVVQLLYETDNITQPLIMGIDPGRTNIGVSVIAEDGNCVFSTELETRNKDIPKLMESRKTHRNKHRHYGRRTVRQRRAKAAGTVSPKGEIERILPGYEKPIVCKGIKNKEARFNNRKRPQGWLTPTANHLLQTHLNLVIKIMKFLPIEKAVLEVNKFAFMALDNPNIKRWEYQKGPLHGKGGVEEAVYAQQNGKCLLCNNGIEHYHHTKAKRENGSNTLPNITGLCNRCHTLVHTDEATKQRLLAKKRGMNKKYHALSVLNQIIPFVAEELSGMTDLYVTDGYSTSAFRTAHSVDKQHYLDAYCIACSILDSITIIQPDKPYRIKQFRRHDRQTAHKEMVDKKYYLNDKVVAVNRHKRFEQKSDSLEECRNTYGDTVTSKLVVKPHTTIYKNQNRWMPGSILMCDDKYFALKKTHGTDKSHKPQYYVDENDNFHYYKKCVFVAHNTGLVFM